MLTRIAPAFRTLPLKPLRHLSTTPLLRSGGHPLEPEPTQTPTKPATTQGHATDKPGHDIQSEYVKQGKANRADAEGSGDAQPFDAARMDGGEAKAGEGTGAFKDQVGGQAGGEAGGGVKGGTEEVPSESTGGKIKKALGMKSSRHFSTSARSLADNGSPDLSGARQPKDPQANTHSDQNPHLKHNSGRPDSGKGNAAAEPHLPSKQANATSGTGTANNTPKGSKGLHTSALSWTKAKYAGSHQGQGGDAGYNVPSEALSQEISSAYNPSEATPPPPSGQTPSSDIQFSSSAQDPPNEALRERVKSGNMPERNPQPSGEAGKHGLDEAWKHRKAT